MDSSLFGAGMFGIIAALFVVSRVSLDAAEQLMTFFTPALNWIQRWLPVFYVPTLITVPLATEGIGGEPDSSANLHPNKLIQMCKTSLSRSFDCSACS